MLKRISHLGLAVKDLDTAIQLYEQVFGLRVAHRWVAEADRMASVGTLAAGVAHEINNPLASVIANLDMAIEDVSRVGVRTAIPWESANVATGDGSVSSPRPLGRGGCE